MNKKKFSFIMRLLFIASLFVGIILNIQYASSIVVILSYYTLQINIMCLICLMVFEILALLNIKYKNKVYYWLKGELIICVLIMYTVYICALMPNNFQMYKFSTQNELANIIVHVVSPLVIILDYLLFDEKGKLNNKYYPISWTVIPLFYVIYVYVYSFNGGRFYNVGGSKKYAYLFLDIEKYGYARVAFWIAIITFGVIALGVVLVFCDKRLAKNKGKYI